MNIRIHARQCTVKYHDPLLPRGPTVHIHNLQCFTIAEELWRMVAIHVYCCVQKLIHSVFKWKHMDQGFFWIKLEQSLLFHLTCSIAHSCCSRTVLRKLLLFRIENAWKILQGTLFIIYFILKLHFLLKLLKIWDIHNWKSNSCIKKRCFFFMTVWIFLGNMNRCFESSARWLINSIKFNTILFYFILFLVSFFLADWKFNL